MHFLFLNYNKFLGLTSFVLLILNLAQNSISYYIGSQLFIGNIALLFLFLWCSTLLIIRRQLNLLLIILIVSSLLLPYLIVGFGSYSTVILNSLFYYIRPFIFCIVWSVIIPRTDTLKFINKVLKVIILFEVLSIAFSFDENFRTQFYSKNLNAVGETNVGQYLALGFFERGFGLDLSPVDTGLVLSLLTLVYLKINKWNFDVYSVLGFTSVLITFNRTAIILMFVFYLYFSKIIFKKNMILIILAFLYPLYYFNNESSEFINLFKFTDESAMSRFDTTLPRAIDIILSYPMGIGIGAANPFELNTQMVENNYFNFFIEIGLICGVIYFYLLYLLLSSSSLNNLFLFNKHNKHNKYITIILLFFILSMLPLSPLYSNSYVACLTFLCVAFRIKPR